MTRFKSSRSRKGDIKAAENYYLFHLCVLVEHFWTFFTFEFSVVSVDVVVQRRLRAESLRAAFDRTVEFSYRLATRLSFAFIFSFLFFQLNWRLHARYRIYFTSKNGKKINFKWQKKLKMAKKIKMTKNKSKMAKK